MTAVLWWLWDHAVPVICAAWGLALAGFLVLVITDDPDDDLPDDGADVPSLLPRRRP